METPISRKNSHLLAMAQGIINHSPCGNTQDLTGESEHSDESLQPCCSPPPIPNGSFQSTFDFFVPKIHDMICSSQEQWWFRSATRRPGGTQITFELAKSCNLVRFVVNISCIYLTSWMVFGFCRVVYMLAQ